MAKVQSDSAIFKGLLLVRETENRKLAFSTNSIVTEKNSCFQKVGVNVKVEIKFKSFFLLSTRKQS
jgi:hypothetical protein